jgi:hypothetical protein
MNSFTKMQIKIIVLVIILHIIIILLTCTDLLYWGAYTIDYLQNRNTYTFKEEAQYSENHLEVSNTFLTKYMNKNRNTRLSKLPRVASRPLPELKIENLSPENVKNISNGFTQPFVVRGLIKDFDCVKKWNLDYFEKEYGNIEVFTFSDVDRLKYSRNGGTKVKQCNNENNLCSIKQICESIRKGEAIYVNNISKLFTVSEQARNELNLDKMEKLFDTKFTNRGLRKQNEYKDPNFMSQLFFGGKNTGTSMHSASNVNFFYNIVGQKKWGFIDPKYSSLIKCQSSHQGLFAIAEEDFFSESKNNPFLRIPRYETVLNPGDFLFNPAWYWHAVKNKTDYTIAVANRYLFTPFGEIPVISNNKMFSFLQLFSIPYYMKWLSNDSKKPHQEIFGNVVDQEIINTVSQSSTL